MIHVSFTLSISLHYGAYRLLEFTIRNQIESVIVLTFVMDQ